MNKEGYRMKLWSDVYSTSLEDGEPSSNCEKYAMSALIAFDKAFVDSGGDINDN